MSSDRARISYDRARQYRAVVAQQGRVTLEADVNEAQEIASETLRLETIDMVGPSGTPDNGYKISAVSGDNAGRDFIVGHGTMYVGGERITLTNDVTYSGQPEWLDKSGDPLWPAANTAAREFVYLHLREQEVSAVEDAALREIALGGPDTAQRQRLLQRIVRMPVTGDTCTSSLQTAQATWSTAGVSFDVASMMLKSRATLRVALVNPPTSGSVCEPAAHGGYLGADNQLIRVQISVINGKGGKLVWGYNNASFLHRLKPLASAASTTLEFLTAPVNSYHAPSASRPSEVLRCAVELQGDPTVDVLKRDYVAAHAGFVTATKAPASDLKSVELPAALPAQYVGVTPLFLRLWEGELSFVSGNSVDLPGTGLSVTIDLGGSAGDFTVGQYWTFAVRPNSPAEVYPHRYLAAPQPPEGPRLWACPLATIGWQKNVLSVLEDCRETFDNLVELTRRRDGGCICSFSAGPTDNLQALIDAIPTGGDAHICLKVGTFALSSTVTVQNKGHILLHGSGPGTKLLVAKGECALHAIGCKSFTARDCAFEGGSVGDGNAGLAHLAGALTITDCPRADISALTLTCAPGLKRSAAGLTIYNAKPEGTLAVVENCVVAVGHLQVGILAVNVETARILDNVVQPAGAVLPGLSLPQRAGVTRALLRELQIVEKKPVDAAAESGRKVQVTVGGNNFTFRTEPSLGISAADWQRFIAEAKPPETMTARAARRWLVKEVQSAASKSVREANPHGGIQRAIKVMTAVAVTPSQGVVVAGARIGYLTVAGNVVRQALQGIHIGVSQENLTTPLYSDRVYVAGNSVTVPPPLGVVARHGIFVGNCRSLQITDNRIDGIKSPRTAQTSIFEGIRVFGYIGLFAVIRANHISGLSIGVNFNPLGTSIPPKPQWIVTDNIAEGAQNVLLAPNAAIRSRIRGAVDNYA